MKPTPEQQRKAEQVFDNWLATPGASWPELINLIAQAIAEAEAKQKKEGVNHG